MPIEPNKDAKCRTPLRQAHRDLTRARIKDAARELFFVRHHDSVPMEQIASAARVTRATLYLHYSNKAEVLSEIIEDYARYVITELAKLPGGNLTEAKLIRWVENIAGTVAQNCVRLSTLLELDSKSTENRGTLNALVRDLIRALGANNEIFQVAADKDADSVGFVRAYLLLQQLIYSCEFQFADSSNRFGRLIREETARAFLRFLSDERQPTFDICS